MKILLTMTMLLLAAATGGATVCKRCTDPNDLDCSLEEEVFCPWGKMCISASVLVESGGEMKTRIYKDCVGRSLCPSPGQRTISTNVGGAFAVGNAQCCNSPRCNQETLPFPDAADHGLNRRFCPACDGCSDTVECRGAEDTCFNAQLLKHGEQLTVYGCGSPDVCSAAGRLDLIPFMEKLGTVVDEPQCSAAPPQTARRCQVCDDPTDPTCAMMTEEDCPLEADKCITVVFADGAIYRGCAAPELCPAVGNTTLSVEIGSMNGLANARCCRGDGCNDDTPAAPVAAPNNGRLCSICFPGTAACNFLIQCQGNEDRCFTTTGLDSGNPILGCTSSSVCSAPSSVNVLLPSLEATGPISCCSGSFCNDPDATTTVAPTTTTVTPPTMMPSAGDKDPLGPLGVSQQMLFLLQQLLLYLQQLQLLLLQCPADLQLLLQPLLLLCQQLLIYVQLMLQPACV